MGIENKYFSQTAMNIIIILFLMILYLYGKGQLTNPSARLDDWEFMVNVPNYIPSHGSPWDKTLWEGRWVNFVWSKIAVHFSLFEICMIFYIGYCLFCYEIASIFSKNPYCIILSTSLLFLSPVYGDLSLWPATMIPSVWISFLLLVIYKRKKILIYYSFLNHYS